MPRSPVRPMTICSAPYSRAMRVEQRRGVAVAHDRGDLEAVRLGGLGGEREDEIVGLVDFLLAALVALGEFLRRMEGVGRPFDDEGEDEFAIADQRREALGVRERLFARSRAVESDDDGCHSAPLARFVR